MPRKKITEIILEEIKGRRRTIPFINNSMG
jgi:hypothetical protein